jgi:hypothetical protein
MVGFVEPTILLSLQGFAQVLPDLSNPVFSGALISGATWRQLYRESVALD